MRKLPVWGAIIGALFLTSAHPLEAHYPPKIYQAWKTYQQEFNQVHTQQDWVRLYRNAEQQSEIFAKPFEEKHTQFVMGKLKEQPQFESVMAYFPGYHLGYAAEGTVLQFRLLYTDFQKLARKTSAKEDDAFIQLMIDAYGESAYHYGNWFLQTWDYGGCSQLGQGTHLKLLKETEKQLAAQSPLSPELNQLRADILKDAFEWKWMCKTRPEATLELQSLKQLNLTATEKQRLDQRLKSMGKAEFSCLTQSCSYG